MKVEDKLSDFLDLFYKEKGYTIEKITGKDNRVLGDKRLRKDTKTLLIEEKSASYLHSNMVIELIQDMRRPDSEYFKGWFFHIRVDLIMYGYYENKTAERPTIVYKVEWKKAKSHFLSEFKKKGYESKLTYGTTDENYGLTFNAYYPWSHLQKIGIVEEVCSEQESLFDVPFEPVKTVQPTPEEVEIAAAEWHEFHKVLDLEGTCDTCKKRKAWRRYKEKKICEHCYLKAIKHWSVIS